MSNVIHLISTTNANVVANSNIPLTTISRRTKCSHLSLVDNTVVLGLPGYYKVSGTVTFTSTAGVAEITAKKSGVEVPGINSSLTAATNTVYTLPIDGVIRVYCGEQPTTLVLENTGVDITVQNVSLTVEYF